MAKQKLVYQFFEENLDNKTDIELIDLAKKGEESALDKIFRKYRDLINMKVNKFFIIGAEKEDIIQEGMIGLYKAIKNFNTEKEATFKSFANLCIERQLITAIKTSNRQKHIPLNSSISLNNNNGNDEDDDKQLLDIINSTTTEDPLDTITKKEYYEEIGTKIENNLSEFEKNVLTRYSMGDSYITIAEKLNSPIKSVDNAIQRIRKKAIKGITEEE